MATIYKTSGETIETSPKNGKYFTLSEMQAIVSGFIEIVDLYDGRLMVVNEEGKLKGLGINHKATEIYLDAMPVMVVDIIVGDVLVCDKKEIR